MEYLSNNIFFILIWSFAISPEKMTPIYSYSTEIAATLQLPKCCCNFCAIRISTISLPPTSINTTAHYCVWGLCESSEHCCDENVCCRYENYNIWITVVIIAGVVIGMILAGTCLHYNLRRIYLYLQQRYYGINSVSIPSEFDSDGKSIKISFQE